MFWNGKLLSTCLSVNGQVYPNLFASLISDLHTYTEHGRLSKINCYSTFFDLVSGKGNEPAVFRNYAARIMNILLKISDDRDVYESLKKLNVEFNNVLQTLHLQISGAELQQGSVRAEFRLKLSDFTSVAQQLDRVFTCENLPNWSICLDTRDVCKLASFHVLSLRKLLTCTMNNFLRELSSPRSNNYSLIKRISSISLLESLLFTTLFTGMPYNFASELVWRKSTIDVESLELVKYIRSHNRIVFRPEFFPNNDFNVTANEDLLNLILGKVTRTKFFQFPPIRQILSFNAPTSTQEYKAELLFEMYFNELNKNAFLPEAGPRWKLAALNRNVITGLLSPCSFRSVVKKVFDFPSFKVHNQWRTKFYMNQASKWINSKPGISNDLLDCLLIEAVRKMGIEHTHYPGTDSFNYNPSIHVQVDLSDQTPGEASTAMPQLLFPDQISSKPSKNNSKEFRDSELCSLVAGVNRYGEGKWKSILGDDRFPFVLSRTPKSLADKWNRLKILNTVRFDSNLRQWSLPGFRTIPTSSISQIYSARVTPRTPQLETHAPVLPRIETNLTERNESIPSELATDTLDSDISFSMENLNTFGLDERVTPPAISLPSDPDSIFNEIRENEAFRILEEPMDSDLEGNSSFYKNSIQINYIILFFVFAFI